MARGSSDPSYDDGSMHDAAAAAMIWAEPRDFEGERKSMALAETHEVLRDATTPNAPQSKLTKLKEIVRSGSYQDSFGVRTIEANVLLNEIDFLYDIVSQNGFTQCLDIGVATGVSYAAMAAAIDAGASPGVLYGVDPYQVTRFQESAVRLCALLDLPCHGVIAEKTLYATAKIRSIVSDLNRPELDFAFIDGWHAFDTTLVDFLLVDDMLRDGGVIAFHDCYYPSKLKVIRFALRHRDYELMRTVAQPRFSAPLRAARLLRNLKTNPHSAFDLNYWRFNVKTDSSIICIRKRSDKKPKYNFFKRF